MKGPFPARRAKPDGAAWDALGWVRSSKADAAEATVVDAAAARAAILQGKEYGLAEGVADARKALVRGLGLPEDAARIVVTFKEREENHGRVLRLDFRGYGKSKGPGSTGAHCALSEGLRPMPHWG